MDNQTNLPINRIYGNYDKYPQISCKGKAFDGFKKIVDELINALPNNGTLVLDCYPQVDQDELVKNFSPYFDSVFYTDTCAFSGKELREKLKATITDDRIFGVMTEGRLDDYFKKEKTEKLCVDIKNSQGKTLVIGVGAALVAHSDILVHCSVARWESQLRFRHGMPNWNMKNDNDDPLTKFKIGYFALWRFADKHKMSFFEKYDYFMDTNIKNSPVMVSGNTYINAVKKVVTRPFRLVPYFDSGVWGGQWMKDVCGLDKNAVNFAWCFDCVPEENSLYYDFYGVRMEMPSIDVVLYQPKELLGDYVYDLYGCEFPIRFDFLDTMNGGNLSLQVHPTKQYIKEIFNMPYTQDESYYILDAEDDACVYLGIKEDADKREFFYDLKSAQESGEMNVEKHVNKWPAKKHDHFLIPGGTVHCSGKNAMVLEISATPYIFTFKLWDWGRLGLDGKPRPINIGHGERVLDFSRNTSWVKNNLINQIELISDIDGNREEKTGLHKLEPIETRRQIFSSPIYHDAIGGVSVMNLVEGEEAVIISPNNTFEPFIVHYAETFVVPASAGDFLVSPTEKSKGQTLMTIKATVRKI